MSGGWNGHADARRQRRGLSAQSCREDAIFCGFLPFTNIITMIRYFGILGVCALLVSACGPQEDNREPEDVFLSKLADMCGRAYAGELVENHPADDQFAGRQMVMHVRECRDGEVLIPFHVGDDHSRTWIITRTEEGLRLKHDHRKEDGTDDDLTQYGGDTRGDGSENVQEFYADEYTAEMLPAAATNIWTMEIHPDSMFAYQLRREADDRRFRVEFDLTQEVETPPTPWGYE
jgi:hypothetical protein